MSRGLRNSVPSTALVLGPWCQIPLDHECGTAFRFLFALTCAGIFHVPVFLPKARLQSSDVGV
jgi:hypothetical protein